MPVDGKKLIKIKGLEYEKIRITNNKNKRRA